MYGTCTATTAHLRHVRLYRSTGCIYTEKLSLGPFLVFQKWYILEASTLHPRAGIHNPPSGNPGYGAKDPYNANNNCLLVHYHVK